LHLSASILEASISRASISCQSIFTCPGFPHSQNEERETFKTPFWLRIDAQRSLQSPGAAAAAAKKLHFLILILANLI